MRKLTLRKDTLAELTTDELGAVVGGDVPTKQFCISGIVECVPSRRCPTGDCIASLECTQP